MKRIKKFVIIILLLTVFGGCYYISYANDDGVIKFKTYKNERYGFSINYPSFLVEYKPSTNNDGVLFKNKDGTEELIVFGYNNIENKSLKETYDEEVSLINDIKYRSMGDNWYVISWEEDGSIYYKKVVAGKRSTNIFSYKYPSNKKKLYDLIIEEGIRSFKTPLINEYN
ncbi:hypothetical protein UT300003_11410 [Clostridium sardiniense]